MIFIYLCGQHHHDHQFFILIYNCRVRSYYQPLAITTWVLSGFCL